MLPARSVAEASTLCDPAPRPASVADQDPPRAELEAEPRAEEREPVAGRRARHVDVRLGDVHVAVRADHRDRHPRLAQRVTLPADRDGDAAHVREGDVGQEGDVHAS